jgi:hypothetical protein
MIRILIILAVASLGQAEVLDDNYVVGGRDANISELPYQVSTVQKSNKSFKRKKGSRFIFLFN